jgi:hypothetical protein
MERRYEATSNQLQEALDVISRYDPAQSYQGSAVVTGEKLVYIPVKGDEVDSVLAEYINHRLDTDGLSVMFLRASEEFYQFGSKLV